MGCGLAKGMIAVVAGEKAIAPGLVCDGIAGGDDLFGARSEDSQQVGGLTATDGLDKYINCLLRRRESLLAVGLSTRARRSDSREGKPDRQQG